MSKMLTVVILTLGWAATAVAGGPHYSRTINLNQPGALQSIQDSDPTHYETIGKIMEGISGHRLTDVPRWMRANFDAKDVKYGVVLTSNPPKRPLSFVLDETRYRVLVTISSNVRVVPTK